MRCFLLDDARTCSTREAFEESIIFLANCGITHVLWHFTDDQGCRIRFSSVPGIGSQPAFTVSETRALIRFARNHGITLIPEIASLGHSRFITRLPAYQHLNEHDDVYSGLCPVHADTQRVLTSLIRETIELFDSPAVHVGMDEVDIGPHPLTRQALLTRSKAQITADHLRFLRQLIVDDGGREMWMWGDGLLASPELMELTPKDIVVCNWQYRPTADDSTTQRLLDAGFDVIPTSALLSHEHTVFPSNEYALKNVQAMQSHMRLTPAAGSARIRGEMVTTWIPARTISDAQWLGWHLATDILQTGESHDRDAAIRTFGQDFYGLSDTDDFARVAHALLCLAPARGQWMAVLKLQPDAKVAPIKSVRQTAADLQTATELLRSVRPAVLKNQRAFDSFQLLLDLLDHAYTSAAYVFSLKSSQKPDLGQLQELLDARTALLANLSDSWDRERFPDDPAKTVPVIHFFRDDHLLLVVRDGQDELERRLNTVLSESQVIA